MAFAIDGSGARMPFSMVIFRKFDTDSSGSIDRAELSALCYHFGAFLSDEELEAAVQTLDADGSGAIEYEEFVAWWNQEERFAALQLDDAALEARHRASEVFQRFDTDKSGAIERNEFGALFAELEGCGLATGTAEEVLAAMDANHDDKVTFNEYVVWLQGATAALLGLGEAAPAPAPAPVALPGLS